MNWEKITDQGFPTASHKITHQKALQSLINHVHGLSTTFLLRRCQSSIIGATSTRTSAARLCAKSSQVFGASFVERVRPYMVPPKNSKDTPGVKPCGQPKCWSPNLQQSSCGSKRLFWATWCCHGFCLRFNHLYARETSIRSETPSILGCRPRNTMKSQKIKK